MTVGTNQIDISLEAGEYVLGTLDETSRARIERDMVYDPELREQVQRWERRLQPLLDDLDPINPPAGVWQNVQAHTIGLSGKRSWWRSLALWRGLALAGVAASLFMGVVLIQFTKLPGSGVLRLTRINPVSMAVVNDKQDDPMWVVQCYKRPWRVAISVVPPEIPTHGKSLQLWGLPKDGKPVSLGLAPTRGEMEVMLSDDVVKMVGDMKAYAVSVEPPGGSPTGQPTGPINYTGGIVAL